MKIITHKNIQYNYYDFLKSTINNPLIDGVSFDVLMTKDKKIILYTPSNDYISTISSLQSNTYDNLKNTDIIALEDAIFNFISTNKKIIINILPIVSYNLTEDNIENINNLNEEYISEIIKVLKKFPNIKFYLCSAYDNLVYQIKRLNTDYKIGFVITNLSSNYIDVDFYVFTVNVIDKNIINQQLAFNKEVMVYILNCDDMNNIAKLIISNNNEISKSTFNEIYFINNYPELFWKLFN